MGSEFVFDYYGFGGWHDLRVCSVIIMLYLNEVTSLQPLQGVAHKRVKYWTQEATLSVYQETDEKWSIGTILSMKTIMHQLCCFLYYFSHGPGERCTFDLN